MIVLVVGEAAAPLLACGRAAEGTGPPPRVKGAAHRAARDGLAAALDPGAFAAPEGRKSGQAGPALARDAARPQASGQVVARHAVPV